MGAPVLPVNSIDIREKSGWTLIGVIWLSLVAALIANIQPLFLGALADAYSLDGRQLGFISGMELGGSCLASLTAAYWFPRFRLQRVAFFALSVGLLGNFFTSWVTDYSQLLVVRFITGFLGSGILYALSLGIVGKLANPDRVIAIIITCQVLSLALGMFSVPLLVERWHLAGVTTSLALLFASGFFFIHALPERVQSFESFRSSETNVNYLPAALLASLILFSVGLGAVWAFMERIGSSAGFALSDIGTALAVSGLIGGLGGLSAAVLGTRMGRLIPISIGISLEIVACLLLATRSDWASYILAIALFNFCWNLTLPYLMGAIAATDQSGRFMVLIPAAQTGGYALGPMLVAIAMVGDDFRIAAWISTAVFFLCVVIVQPLLRKVPRPVAFATEQA